MLPPSAERGWGYPWVSGRATNTPPTPTALISREICCCCGIHAPTRCRRTGRERCRWSSPSVMRTPSMRLHAFRATTSSPILPADSQGSRRPPLCASLCSCARRSTWAHTRLGRVRLSCSGPTAGTPQHRCFASSGVILVVAAKQPALQRPVTRRYRRPGHFSPNPSTPPSFAWSVRYWSNRPRSGTSPVAA